MFYFFPPGAVSEQLLQGGEVFALEHFSISWLCGDRHWRKRLVPEGAEVRRRFKKQNGVYGPISDNSLLWL